MKFNFKFKKKAKVFGEKYREEIKEEIKNNSTVLSFAVAIIVVGIVSIFYKNSDTLLIGIAVSSLMLTIIQCINNGNTILNIFPLVILLLFGFFPKTISQIPVANILLYKQGANFIIFMAFALTFLTQAYKNVGFRYKIRLESVNYNKEKNRMISTQLEVIKNIKDRTTEIKKVALRKSYKDKEYRRVIKELIEYVENEAFISNVKATLITKGSDNLKTTFNIEEVEESLILNEASVRNRRINIETVQKEEKELSDEFDEMFDEEVEEMYNETNEEVVSTDEKK